MRASVRTVTLVFADAEMVKLVNKMRNLTLDEVAIEQLLNHFSGNGNDLAVSELILAELISGVDAGFDESLCPLGTESPDYGPQETLLELQLLARGLVGNEHHRLGIFLKGLVEVLDGDLGEGRHNFGVNGVKRQALLLSSEDLLVEGEVRVVGIRKEISDCNRC